MPNNDYTKRSDVIKALYQGYEKLGLIVYRVSCIGKINQIPAADVEPVVHGRWVKMTGMMPPEFTGHYSCSECDWFCKKHSVRETDFDFCPGCGAEMTEIDDGN